MFRSKASSTAIGDCGVRGVRLKVAFIYGYKDAGFVILRAAETT